MIALSFPLRLIPGAACRPGPPARQRDGPQADSRYMGMNHKEQSAAPAGRGHHRAVCAAASPVGPRGPPPPPPHTFFGLGIGDVQVAAGHLQLLTAHDLALEVHREMWRPLKVNGRVDDGEKPTWPWLGLRSLSRTQHSQAQPLAMATRVPLPQCSAEAFPGCQLHGQLRAHYCAHATAPTPPRLT